MHDFIRDFKHRGLKQELNQDIEEKIINHRNNFYYLFIGRYYELLPSLITYLNPDDDHHQDMLSFSHLELELLLRNNQKVALGLNDKDNIVILGYINETKKDYGLHEYNYHHRFNQDDIEFIITEKDRKDGYLEIVESDNFSSGNFVVLKNKHISLVSDFDIIQYYTMELAEIVVSRFSLSMQAKILTFFLSEYPDNETVNQLVSDLYNGSPYVKVDKFFDPEEHIYQMNNTGLSNNFIELKREYQNKISELNNMLGVNSLAVEKSSGVSDLEAKGNQAFTGSNANIYLESRQSSLDKLNKRYDLNIKAFYNDDVRSELSLLSNLESEGVANENHNNVT